MNLPLALLLAYLLGWFAQQVWTNKYRALAKRSLNLVKSFEERADVYVKLYEAAEAELEQARADAARPICQHHHIIIQDLETWHRYADLVRAERASTSEAM